MTLNCFPANRLKTSKIVKAPGGMNETKREEKTI